MLILFVIAVILAVLFTVTSFFGGYNGNKQDGYVVGLCGIIGMIGLIVALCLKEDEPKRDPQNRPSDRSYLENTCKECGNYKYGEVCRHGRCGNGVDYMWICDDCYVDHMRRRHGVSVIAPIKR